MPLNTQADPTEPLDFVELILGFSSAALYYIGENDIDGKKISTPNFPLALQNIAIIETLQKKTRGNLTPNEQQILTEIIHNLKEKYEKERTMSPT